MGLFIGIIILIFTTPEIALIVFLASCIAAFTLIIYAKYFTKMTLQKETSERTDRWTQSYIDDLRRLTEYKISEQDILSLLEFEDIVFEYCKIKSL